MFTRTSDTHLTFSTLSKLFTLVRPFSLPTAHYTFNMLYDSFAGFTAIVKVTRGFSCRVRVKVLTKENYKPIFLCPFM